MGISGQWRGRSGLVTRGADGNYYGATETGGELYVGSLYRMTPDGTLTPDPARPRPPRRPRFAAAASAFSDDRAVGRS